MKRIATALHWLSIVLIVLCLALIVQQFPLGPAVGRLEGWRQEMGIWSPLAFGLLYVVAVVALMPGSALTLAAGALFGLVGGTIVASLASTTGASLAFLISRYLARERVRTWLRRSPKFDAIDKAIGENGWKIVALLRLSPAVPFNLQNYLYGLTGIRFWPYVLTSWLAMLPATFLYVYLGDLGRVSLQAAAGNLQRPRSAAEWGMLIVGLLATVVVTVYLTRLARKALRQHIGTAEAVEPVPIQNDRQTHSPSAFYMMRSTLLFVLALAALAVAGYARFHSDLFQRLFDRLFGSH